MFVNRTFRRFLASPTPSTHSSTLVGMPAPISLGGKFNTASGLCRRHMLVDILTRNQVRHPSFLREESIPISTPRFVMRCPLDPSVSEPKIKQWTFLVFFGIFELGSVLCGAAVSSAMLIFGRTVAGFGAAGIIIGAITIISSCAPLEKRPGM